jgi:hypothetical protein
MRGIGRWLIAAVALASLGCATGLSGAPSEPPMDVSGNWSGKLVMSPLAVLGCCGGTSGEAQVEFQQDGTNVTGSLTAPGIRGTIKGFVNGTALSGYLRFTAGSSGNGRFDAQVVGNEMLAETLDAKLILSRVR